jgi:hypothetical protein
MPTQRLDYARELQDWFERLSLRFESSKFLRHQDLNIEVENFFRDLLNLVFDWELGNANFLFGQNQDSFDLSDTSARVAVQVTVTTSAKKIKDTLKKFVGTHEKNYDRLLFLYPKISVSKTSANFTPLLSGFPFEANRDRVCLGDIMTATQDLTVIKQGAMLDLVRTELAPLGKTLQLGVDQTIETLINAIEYMSENVSADEVDTTEVKPDQLAKLERLKEHASFLKDQYRLNYELHATIHEAKNAIGYDNVRAAKIQAWLRLRSLELLDERDGDAKSAFLDLTEKLLDAAHERGTNAEETAVRFLLADEFTRCNVFPNPAID